MSVSCILQGQDTESIKLENGKFIQNFEDITQDVQNTVGVAKHASTHAIGGDDLLSPNDIGAVEESEVGNLYLWEKRKIYDGRYINNYGDDETHTYYYSTLTSTISVIYIVIPSINDDNAIEVENIIEEIHPFDDYGTLLEVFSYNYEEPFYFQILDENNDDTIYCFMGDGDFNNESPQFTINYYIPTVEGEIIQGNVEYVTDSDVTTYPKSGKLNGYTYELKGKIGELGNSGDYYTKEESLSDETTALYGLDKTAVPDDALKATIARLGTLDAAVFDHAATYYWNKYFLELSFGDDLGTTTIHVGSTGTGSNIFYYSDSVTVKDDFTLELVDPSSITLTYNKYSLAENLIGKYFYTVNNSNSQIATGPDNIYFVPSTATYSRTYDSTGYYTVTLTALQRVSAKTFDAIVSAPVYDAYPYDGAQDGFYYQYSYADKSCLQIETGTYVGTDSAITLTFGFVPQVVWIYAIKGSNAYKDYYMAYGDKISPIYWGATFWQPLNAAISSAQKLSYPTTNSITIQYTNSNYTISVSGSTYLYYAIG